MVGYKIQAIRLCRPAGYLTRLDLDREEASSLLADKEHRNRTSISIKNIM